jgi:hypothetical protein
VNISLAQAQINKTNISRHGASPWMLPHNLGCATTLKARGSIMGPLPEETGASESLLQVELHERNRNVVAILTQRAP